MDSTYLMKQWQIIFLNLCADLECNPMCRSGDQKAGHLKYILLLWWNSRSKSHLSHSLKHSDLKIFLQAYGNQSTPIYSLPVFKKACNHAGMVHLLISEIDPFRNYNFIYTIHPDKPHCLHYFLFQYYQRLVDYNMSYCLLIKTKKKKKRIRYRTLGFGPPHPN